MELNTRVVSTKKKTIIFLFDFKYSKFTNICDRISPTIIEFLVQNLSACLAFMITGNLFEIVSDLRFDKLNCIMHVFNI